MASFASYRARARARRLSSGSSGTWRRRTRRFSTALFKIDENAASPNASSDANTCKQPAGDSSCSKDLSAPPVALQMTPLPTAQQQPQQRKKKKKAAQASRMLFVVREDAPPTGGGGGLNNYEASASLINTIITNNTAQSYGGGVWNDDGDAPAGTAFIKLDATSSVHGNDAPKDPDIHPPLPPRPRPVA